MIATGPRFEVRSSSQERCDIVTPVRGLAAMLRVRRWGGLACATAFAACGASPSPAPPASAGVQPFVGSAACESCHRDIYSRWKTTLMANVVRDPKQHPDAIVGDFSKPNPLVTFKQEDVAFTYGSKWKQRYFTKIGDDYFVFPAQWDVQNKTGGRTRRGPAPTGGRASTRRTRCSGRRVRCATAVTR